MDNQSPSPLEQGPSQRSGEVSPGKRRAIGIGMICAGLLLSYASYRAIAGQRQFAAQAKHTQGQVVRIVTRSSGSRFVWVPVFTFNDESGKQWRVTSHDSNNASPYHVGDEVEVLYLPQDPSGAKLDDLTSSWGASAMLVFCAIFCLGIGYLVCRTTPFVIEIGSRRRQ